MIFKGPEIAPAHRRPPSVHEILHRAARSLRRTISLLSMFPAVAGVQPETSRSIKPRERDLGDLHLFFLVRILTRPTNHPRHAACASNHQSKPVRPRFLGEQTLTHVRWKNNRRHTRPIRTVSGQIASFSFAGFPHACSRSEATSSTGSRCFAAMKLCVADQVRR
jgi:hypothetical protein